MTRVAIMLFLVVGLGAAPGAQAAASKAERFIRLFDTEDGLARRSAYQQFESEIPPAERAQVLAEVWEQGKSPRVERTVMGYLLDKSAAAMPWNDRLRDRVFGAATSGDVRTRRLSFNVLRLRPPEEGKPRLQGFLDDADEEVRGLAITEVSHWPEGRAILEEYVRKHQTNPKWEQSVSRARFLLSKRRE